MVEMDSVTDNITTAPSKIFPPFIEIESSPSALNVMLIPVPASPVRRTGLRVEISGYTHVVVIAEARDCERREERKGVVFF